jgi:hypothetical protein
VSATSEPSLPLPSFVIIGAQKSATRWLRDNLGRHPDIYTAASEIAFFNSRERYDDLGVDWYRRQFEGWAGEPIVGEATPGYMMWRHGPKDVARRVEATVPKAHLVAILRNPIDRADSALRHHIKHGRLPRDASLLELVWATPPEEDPLGLVAGGWYAASLGPFRRRYRKKLLTILHEDVDAEPGRVYGAVLEHLGADTHYVPDELERVVFSTQPDQAERRRPPLTQDERCELWPFFQHDVNKLQRMLRRDLSTWDPEVRSAHPLGI